MAPGEKTKTMFYADDRVFWVVESGQMRVNIEGQAPFLATKGFLVQAAPRLAYSTSPAAVATDPPTFGRPVFCLPSGRLSVIPRFTCRAMSPVFTLIAVSIESGHLELRRRDIMGHRQVRNDRPDERSNFTRNLTARISSEVTSSQRRPCFEL
jgi:hypothetical protein